MYNNHTVMLLSLVTFVTNTTLYYAYNLNEWQFSRNQLKTVLGKGPVKHRKDFSCNCVDKTRNCRTRRWGDKISCILRPFANKLFDFAKPKDIIFCMSLVRLERAQNAREVTSKLGP